MSVETHIQSGCITTRLCAPPQHAPCLIERRLRNKMSSVRTTLVSSHSCLSAKQAIEHRQPERSCGFIAVAQKKETACDIARTHRCRIMIPAQEAHANKILQASGNLREIRFQLCPRLLPDEVPLCAGLFLSLYVHERMSTLTRELTVLMCTNSAVDLLWVLVARPHATVKQACATSFRALTRTTTHNTSYMHAYVCMLCSVVIRTV
jgi:hypothetical protein